MNKNSNELKGKTLLVVNLGSTKKKFVLQKLKKFGINIVALHREKNWAEPYVDHWIIADTSNHKECIEKVRLFMSNKKIKIDGVYTYWEEAVLLAAKLADIFNWVGIPYNVAIKAKNKYLFREFCEQNGIKAPKHTIIRDKKSLSNIDKLLKFPVVTKPVYGSFSAYVIKVNNKEELLEAYEYIQNHFYTNPECHEFEGYDILVEEYIDGDEVDIDILTQNGKIKFFAISDNFNKDKGSFFVDSGQSIPSTLPVQEQRELRELIEEILEKIGIFDGCIHFEAKSTSRGPYPIELNIRMGGDYIYSYIKDAWDIDLVEYSAMIALGIYVKIDMPEKPKEYLVGWDLHPNSSGLVVELNMDEELKKKKYFKEIHFYKEVGDPILLPPEGYESMGWLTVSGDNFLDAQDNLKDALNHVKFNVVEFDDESSVGKTSRKNRLSSAVLNKNLLLKAAKIEKVKKITFESQRNLHIGIVGNTSGFATYNNWQIVEDVQHALVEKGYQVSTFDFSNPFEAFNQIKYSSVDLVFNTCDQIHSSRIMEPHIAALLEVLQVPVTGSSSFTLGLCRDKIKVKKLLTYHNIPTPKWDYAYKITDEISEDLKYPLIVKPANTDDSIGITNDSVVKNKEQLDKQLKKIIESLKSPALVEEYIQGDEYDVSIIGNDENDLQVLPLARSIFKKMPRGYQHIYSFNAKKEKDKAYKNIIVQRPPKNIEKKLESLITEISLDTYNVLGCQGYGLASIRVDDDDNPYVLELDPNPSLNRLGNFVSAANLTNMKLGDLAEEIIWLAIKRFKNRISKKYDQVKSRNN